MSSIKEWFGEWFNSPYYHILYKDRDDTEAHLFLDNLIGYLDIKSEDRIMDLACGKGRHSIYLNRKGFSVVGLDLSPTNIELANQHKNESLQFYVYDMRHPYDKNKFDYVLNIFTSFGYFETESENQLAITNMSNSLRYGGILILDFLNPYKVINHLTPEEIKVKQGIEFHITKALDNNGFIVKTIKFNHNNENYIFQEKVKAIRRKEFLSYFDNAGLSVETIFGDYDLHGYDCDHSERMIFIVKK